VICLNRTFWAFYLVNKWFLWGHGQGWSLSLGQSLGPDPNLDSDPDADSNLDLDPDLDFDLESDLDPDSALSAIAARLVNAINVKLFNFAALKAKQLFLSRNN